MSVAMTFRSQPAVEGSSSRRAIAIEYGSSPVEQPALQIRTRRPRVEASRTSSGSTCWRRARAWGGLRKKCVSWIVTSSRSGCSSGEPGASTRRRYAATSGSPVARSRSPRQ